MSTVRRLAMTDDISTKIEDWDKWLKANPRLENLVAPLIQITTTDWDEFHIGWISVIDNLEKKNND
jgi:hypothetical protein